MLSVFEYVECLSPENSGVLVPCYVLQHVSKRIQVSFYMIHTTSSRKPNITQKSHFNENDQH